MNQGEALEILEIIKAFFNAILEVFKALGIEFGTSDGDEATTV